MNAAKKKLVRWYPIAVAAALALAPTFVAFAGGAGSASD
jgi:hypothetical protein